MARNNITLPAHATIGSEYKLMQRYGTRINCAPVTCPDCQKQRWLTISELHRAMKRGTFSGRCRPCRLASAPLPPHPSVGRSYRKENNYKRGWMATVADVTCPTCGKVRTFPLSTMRQQMQLPHFNGQCIKCGQLKSRQATRNTLRLKFEGKKRIVANGYVAISGSAIPDADLALFEAMRGKGSFIFEHRLVLARKLGRPLKSNECVDHKDGNKQNNKLRNLRLYRKGTGDPGSIGGHGTYYHEWQMALAKISALESAI